MVKRSIGKGSKGRDAEAPRGSGEDGWEELPDPVRVEGWFLIETGNVLEGALAEREEGEYGPFYKVRVARDTKCKGNDKKATKVVKRGGIVAIDEKVKFKPWAARMRSGPTAVRVTVGPEAADGFGYEYKVEVRNAF